MTTYSVRPGDTLSAIARRYQTSVPALAKANDIANPSLILVGAKLRIPGSAFEAPKPKPARVKAAPSPSTRDVTQKAAGPIASSARLAVIGDSHTAGAFGNALEARLQAHLRQGGGQLTGFTGIPGASVSTFLSGGTTHTGSGTYRAPTVAAVLAKKPKVLTVALGTNMLFNSSSANRADIKKLLAKADAAGTRVVWVGPPNVRGYGGSLAGGGPEARFYAALESVNTERRAKGRVPMVIIDSRQSTAERNTLDGLHFGGSNARDWARQVFTDATR